MSETMQILPGQSQADLDQQIEAACALMERHYASGVYSKLTVVRSWSKHNPTISGSIARPSAFRWYLRRELTKLAQRGAQLHVAPSRARVDLNAPKLLQLIDESDFDHTRKKVFLFGPERAELSIQRLEHYTGTQVEDFQRYVLLTNYQMHMNAFIEAYPDCIRPQRTDVQMPALHQRTVNNDGVTIINIGVGPSNAKNLTDHIAVLRPDAMLMVGHCAGIRNHQEIGDFVLGSGYMRADRLLDQTLPTSVPLSPNFVLNRNLARVLDERKLPYRFGVVYTTIDRNWELTLRGTLADLRASRSIAVDMESATVAANGFRYRIPSATLLCVSDKPLHGKPKLAAEALEFYKKTKSQHLAVAIAAIELAKQEFPGGFPNSDIRAMDEPLLGGPET
ncbi:AMP nucleosidase [Rosistilla oblonga]|uniref:AMP nucleosidase n=1 Tax=Rosistilla oblonga TaxID=2527990 RepID=A0A518IRT5_9BACT|nr:AMP nucleosidase [Rosistilla oblonga]QDV55800.1 AMP nucleosidase [Rosistilla oblonga]